MKFGHSFLQTLESEDFPEEWRSAAIPYRQLKKCIKRVHAELAELGLDAVTLKSLLAEQPGGLTLTYFFDGTMQSFQPKLTLTMDTQEGIPLDVGLAAETRRNLERFMRQGKRIEEIRDEMDSTSVATSEAVSDPEQSSLSPPDPTEHERPTSAVPTEATTSSASTSTFEIPLTSDSEFFHMLTKDLTWLETLQSNTVAGIESSIVALGDSVTALTYPTSFSRQSDLYPWREIFQLYMESNVFISNLEVEMHAEQPVEAAQERLRKFNERLVELGLSKRFKNRGSGQLLMQFLRVNEEVLRVMRFQAINRMAMQKILKKFDKRTSLCARSSFPSLIAEHPLVATSLGKAICVTMSARLLNILPQLDDYLCPVCSSIAIKPIRLECMHFFCVRCLVKLQRERQRFCPLCRRDVVMKADSTNLDIGLLNFLTGYFPIEAKEKQRENEIEKGRELWGNIHTDDLREGQGCVIS